jgi:hypothetical protein
MHVHVSKLLRTSKRTRAVDALCSGLSNKHLPVAVDAAVRLAAKVEFEGIRVWRLRATGLRTRGGVSVRHVLKTTRAFQLKESISKSYRVVTQLKGNHLQLAYLQSRCHRCRLAG